MNEALTLSVQNKHTARLVVSMLFAQSIDVFFCEDSDSCLHFGWGINRVIASAAPLRGKPADSLMHFIQETKNNFPWLSPQQVAVMQQDILINDLLQNAKIHLQSKL